MIAGVASSTENRLLVLAPVGRDAQLVQTMLKAENVECRTCANIAEVLRELEVGAAALLLTEEALVDDDSRLAATIAHQPPWSDFPVLLLTRSGADSPVASQAVATLGNVTLLERPVRTATLASAVRSALRARARQYLTRAHLLEREEADRRKDEFLALLAHELRNPLAPIRNAVSLLRRTASDHAEIWQMMERQVGHMARLLDDLMELSRITRGAIELRKEPTELGAAIAAAVETCRPLIDAARHRLALDLPPEPLLVEADHVRLTQVLVNLVNNAVKYTDPGGEIRLRTRVDDGHAVVTVADSGVGIPADVLPRIFDMFVQADGTDRRSQGGLGIGLTLARRLVEMHGGSLTAHSAGSGRGSEFTVRLPLLRQDASRGSSPAAAPHHVAGLPRILVVDDNRDAADTLGALLTMLGAEVRVTYDGQAALEEISSFRPAAVFLDLGMPDMDGHEVARRILANPRAPHPVLVALTGWGQENDRKASQAAGFDRHLVKPADMEELEDVLASLG
jgi:two-component system, sensor histidine kinase